YMRFMQSLKELTPDMLVRFTQIDYDRELALVAVTDENGKEAQIAVARYAMNPDGESCEFALVVADEWHRKGSGARLVALLIEAPRARGFRVIDGQVLSENTPMLVRGRRLGFHVRYSAAARNVCGVRLALQ